MSSKVNNLFIISYLYSIMCVLDLRLLIHNIFVRFSSRFFVKQMICKVFKNIVLSIYSLERITNSPIWTKCIPFDSSNSEFQPIFFNEIKSSPHDLDTEYPAKPKIFFRTFRNWDQFVVKIFICLAATSRPGGI